MGSESKKLPNIIIFNPDQWRGDVLHHMGNPAAHTPNLDQLVQEDAVSFRNAFCQNPVCTPSRCSFMTGWYPHTRGHRTMHYMLHKDHYEPNLLNILKKNGYYVWWGGKNDLISGKEGHYRDCNKKYIGVKQFLKNLRRIIGQDRMYIKDHEWRGPPDGDNYYSFMVGEVSTPDDGDFFTLDTAMVMGAVDFIKRYRKKKPFCIYLPLTFPHPQYAVDDPWFSMINREKIPKRIPDPKREDEPIMLKAIRETQNLQNWSEDRWKELRATYYGMCAKTDEYFGRVINALKEKSLYDDTAVFFFSDHGDFTGDYGLVEKNQNTFPDCLTNIPFIVKPPKDMATNSGISDAIVELTDFSETVYEMTGIDPDYTRFGRSLIPILKGETDEHRDAAYCEGGRLMGETQAMEMESKSSIKPSGLYYPRIKHQITDEKPYHGKAAMCRTKKFKYIQRLYEKDELYDLENDPDEIDNKIEDPEYNGILANLRHCMLRWYMETCDYVPKKTDQRFFRPNLKTWLLNLFGK